MRGPDERWDFLFSYVSPEQRVPADHPVVRQYSDRCANHVANTSRTERSVGLATTSTTRWFFELRVRTAYGQARAGKLISHCRRSRRHCRRARKKAGVDAARLVATVGAASRPLLLR